MKNIIFIFLCFPTFLVGDINDSFTNECCEASPGSNDLVEYETIVNSDSFYNVYTETPTIFSWRAPGEYCWKYAIELRVGGSRPQNSRVLKTYGRSIEYEIEGTWRDCYQKYEAWVNVSYLSQKRHIHTKHRRFDHERHSKNSRFQQYPVSLGLKRSFYISDNFYLYAGLGVSSTNVQGNFFSDLRHVHKQAWGAVAKGGILYDFNCGIYFDFYCDYYYTVLTSRGDSLNVGGVRAGFGMGINY